MISRFSVKFLLLSMICLLAIGGSQECKRKVTRRNGPANGPGNGPGIAPISSIVFFPDVNVSLPSGETQRQINCTGDCDEDAFNMIQCKGNYQEKNYKCDLIDAIPNYELVKYEAICIENRPVRAENCYLNIELKKTLFRWRFDSRLEIQDPRVPGNFVAQALCNGEFCDRLEYTLVECLGVYAKQQYTCSIVDPPLPSSLELADYSIICKNFREKNNNDCYVVVRLSEKKTEVDPKDRTRKILLAIGVAIAGLLLITSVVGCLIYFLNR